MSFDIDLSTRQARAEVLKLERRILRLGRTADGASARMQAGLGSLGGAHQLRNIEAAIGGVTSQLVRMGQQQQNTFAAGTAGSKRLNKAVGKTSQTIRTGRKAAETYGDSLLTISQKAAILRSGMLALGTHVGIFTARTLLAATVTFGLVKAIQASITVGAQFTRELAATSAIAGSTREELSGLTQEMLDLAETTKFTTTEVASAATVLAKTGLKSAQIAQALPPVLNLAAIGAMDMAKAADIAANSMFGFQLQASSLGTVVDTLAFAATNSNTTVEQLGRALSFAAPVAQAASAKFSDVAAMMAVMANSGVKASRAGTTLRRAYVNLLDPAAKVQEVLNDLGITVRDDVSGEMRSMVDIMRDFAKANGSAADIVRIFGVRAAPGMIAVWKDMAKEVSGADSFMKDFFARLATEGVGSSEKMRDAMEENLIDVWLKFKSVVSVKATEAFLLIEKSIISNVRALTAFVKETVQVGSAVETVKIHMAEWGKMFDRAINATNGTRSAFRALRVGLKFEAQKMSESLGFVEQALLDIPINLTAVTQIIGVLAAQTVASLDTLTSPLARFSENFKHFFLKAAANVNVGFRRIFDSLFDWFSTKIFAMADAVKTLPGFGDIALKLEAAAFALNDLRGGDEAGKSLAAEISRHEKVLALLDEEEARKMALRKSQNALAKEMIDNILLQRNAQLSSRDASLEQIAVNKAEAESLAQLIKLAAAKRDMANSIRAAEADAGISGGRVKPKGPATDLLGTSAPALKDFIKLQKQSVTATIDQLKHLEKMNEIDPFSALIAGAEKSKQSLKDVELKFAELIVPLLKFQKTFEVAGFKAIAAKYTEAINKVIKAYVEQTETIRKGAREQGQALELLRSKYEVIADAQDGFRLQPKRAALGFEDSVGFIEELRAESEGGLAEISRRETEQLTALSEAAQMRVALREGEQAQAILSESEHERLRQQIKDNFERERLNKSASFYKKEALLEENLHLSKAKAVASGFAAYTAEGAKSSKKLFEINKKARMAQILVDTPAAMSGAFTHGAALGGPYLGAAFALLALANQAALLNQVKSSTFGGGGSVSAPTGGGATTTAPQTAINIPPQSDAIFSQTDSGGSTNTVDSSLRAQGDLTVKFEVTAFDATDVDQLLLRRKPMFVGMIQEAYNEQGRGGGPVS